MLLLALFLASAPPRSALACGPIAPVVALISAERARYPLIQLDDVLKVLQQTTMGSEHATADSSEAARWMTNEWQALGVGTGERLVDTLGQPAHFARVNLRPYRQRGGSPSRLLTAFLNTGRGFHGDRSDLRCALDVLQQMAERHAVPWRADSIAARARRWSASGFPAVEHSAAYEAAYHPSYRVVALPLLPALLAGLRR